ncbi:MAG: GEVED domain-containing protein, partial [Bacteroidota bacterium]
GGSGTYEVLVGGNPLGTPVTQTSGQDVTISLPADGNTADISFRDNSDASCVSSDTTTIALNSCSNCSITGTIINETCNDNNTGANTADDFYQIRVTATLANGTSTNYEVLVDGNPLSPPLFAASGMDTVFNLPADGTSADITFRDAGDPSCVSVVAMTNALDNCSTTPCSITGNILSETCNDNGTVGTSTDDTYDIVVNATLTNGTSTNYEVLVDGNPLAPPVTAASGANASINIPASGSPAAISFRDAGDVACVSTVENTGTLNSCYDCEVIIDIVEIASCVGNNFDVTTTVNWTNAPIGDLEFSIDGGNTFNTLGRPNSNVDATGVELELAGLVCSQTKSFIIRFAGQPGCFAEGVFLFPPADPAGYIYCAETGEIITGGTVSVTPPVGGTFEFIVSGGEELDGSNGRYEWIATGSPVTAGRYTMSFTPPAELSLAGTPGAVAFGNGDAVLDPNDFTVGGDNPAMDDPLLIGSAINGAGTALVDFTAAANPFFFEFDLENSDPFVDHNNIPVTGCFRDYGDLPDFGVPGSYATDLDDNGEGLGAAHVILPNFNIGPSIDNESDGQPGTTALDDGSDEDGVTLPNAFYPGQTGVEVPVTVEVPNGTSGQLIGWIDWNGDGVLSPGEAASSSTISGNTGVTQTVTLTFDVPANAVTVRPLGARFRLFDATETSQSSTGTALLGGEVEDYLVSVRPCPSNNCR